MSFYNWRRKDKKFDEAVYEAIESRTQIVEDALYKNCLQGNVTAQIFYLKNRSRGRWRDKFEFGVDEIKVKIDIEEDEAGSEGEKESL